jgi:O-antigen/teichoic acid export membrane protein
MAVALVLARLLTPHAWGLAAMVVLFSSFVIVFTDSALGTALIQRRDLTDDDKSTVFWMSAAIGLVLMAAGIALSGPLARFYGEPDVRPLFAVLAAGFFVSTLGATQLALFVREMDFRLLELRQIAATVVGASVAISIALAHFGAWAIVSQQVAEATASTALLWYLSKWRPSFRFSMASLRKLGGFAGNVFGENLLYQAGRNLSSLLIGRFLGPVALGTYALATNVILVPFSRIAGPLQQVFFPAFSQMTDNRERLAEVWIRATRLVGVVSIPSLVGLAIVAPDFVHVVLGNRWTNATTVIQILTVVGLVQSLQTLSGEVLLALNRAGWLLRFTMLWFAGNVVAFVIGLHWGMIGVATCYAVATVVIEPIRTAITSRALGISPWRFVRAFAGVAQAAAVMATGVLVGRAALIAAGAPAGLRLPLLVALGGLLYVGSCFWRAPELRAEVAAVASRRRTTPMPAVQPAEAPGR